MCYGTYYLVLPSNVSQCTSTTDSQELALNCTVHKILLTVFTINQLIHNYLTAIAISCQSLLYSLTESGKSVCKCERTILIWTRHLKLGVSEVWMENSPIHKPRWSDLLTWDLLLSDFIPFLTFKSHFCDSLLTQWHIGLNLYLIWGYQKIL